MISEDNFIESDLVSQFLNFASDQEDASLTNDIDDGSATVHCDSFNASIESLSSIMLGALQNVVNSTSLLKHRRNFKSSLPFLYNQTMKKIDERTVIHKDTEAILMVRPSYNPTSLVK